MGNRIGKIEEQDWWVVYQSSSMSVYSPIFYDNLGALMFARLYSSDSRAELLNKDFSDSAQSTVAGFIIMFLNEVCPEDAFGRRLPKQWVDEMDPKPADWSEEEDGVFRSDYAYELLVEAFNNNYECAQADIVMREFAAWRAKNGYGILPQKTEAVHA